MHNISLLNLTNTVISKVSILFDKIRTNLKNDKKVYIGTLRINLSSLFFIYKKK